jgi:F-type H+-transporting ATPase subunit delta
VNPTLQGYAAAVLESVAPDQLAPVASELNQVEQLVLATPALRAALTDTAVTGPARQAVMRDLLQGKVSEPARQLAAFATGAVPAPDVLAALTWSAHRAQRLADGVREPEPPLSLLGARQRVGGFARELYESMSTEELEGMEDSLFRFARIVASTPALRTALTDRDQPVESRQGLISQLLEGKVGAETLALVHYVVAGGRARDFVGTLDWLVEQTASARGWRIARVRSAADIEEAQRSGLSDTLASLVGAPVELQVVLDPSLLSGAVIEIGDLQVDASARGRIDALREHLVPGGWDDKGFGSGANRSGGSTTEGAV